MEKVAGSSVPARVGELYRTPRPHPWRPTLGYETVQLRPLHHQPVTDQLMDPCYTPQGMSTEPMTFPNLVTGFARNPGHAARASLYTRYTPCDWSQNQIRLKNDARANCNQSDKLRSSMVKLMREADDLITNGQKNAGRELGKRITDVSFWERELAMELERVIIENSQMQECKRRLQKCIQDLEGPLHIAQECLYYREARQEMELVHDAPEQSLLREVEIIRNCMKKLNKFISKCDNQLTNGRAVQNELELDIANKNSALGIDTMCQQLNNFSKGLQYFGGIEKYNNCVIDEQTWVEACDAIVKRAQENRAASQQLRADVEIAINAVGQEVWDAWSETNNALSRRVTEIFEAKQSIQSHLQDVQNDIFGIEKNIELIQKAITDKSAALKVAHTRLEARCHRVNLERCCDSVNGIIIKEIETINMLVHELHSRLQECEAQHQELLRTRAALESDLKGKVDALFVDKEKCLGMRRSYPILDTVKY
ncbi:tektin-3-like isoform X2 [Aphidius gifuensis]|nr:tektin-3-like isoform X2 [Aphidius gifuensis]